jgi:hypothetical protein
MIDPSGTNVDTPETNRIGEILSAVKFPDELAAIDGRDENTQLFGLFEGANRRWNEFGRTKL